MTVNNGTNENFAELFAQLIQEPNKEGTIITGHVVAIEKDNVIIDIGLKTEGILQLKELSVYGKKPEIAIGDEIEVFLERIESRNGYAILSREKALREKSWHILEKSQLEGENIKGVITGRIKGGFTVDLNGIIAFLPGSQLDVRPIKDVNLLIGKEEFFKILKMVKKAGNLGNIVVSRRAILEEIKTEAKKEQLSKISEGQILEGIVKNITDYGVFVDLGDVDGLLHVTDISWRRISHPSEILSLGQKITVMVIKFHEEAKRISLGMKQLEKNPWEGIETRFPKNTRFKGRITNITDYGAFIELEPGIEGLVHVSEISWNKNTLHPRKLVSVGEEIDFIILDIDPSKHRISLGIKQCSENPWAEFAKLNPIGSVVTGEIKNIVEFGIFVGFNEYVDGLVHISDVSWESNQSEKLKEYSKGKNIQVKILSIDIEKERISLGIKQLQNDPLESFMQNLNKKQVIECSVKNVESEGLVVEVASNPDVQFYIPKNELSSNKSEQKTDKYSVDDKISALIDSIDKENRIIKLSVKNLELQEHKKAMAEYSDSNHELGNNLGDLLGAVINTNKK